MHEKLKAARKAKRLTQSDVAKQLGLSTSAISNYEQGIRVPDLVIMSDLLRVYGLAIHDILDSKEHRPITLRIFPDAIEIGGRKYKCPMNKQVALLRLLYGLKPII